MFRSTSFALLGALVLHATSAAAATQGDVIGPTFTGCPTDFTQTIGVSSANCGTLGGTWQIDVTPSDADTVCAWRTIGASGIRVVVYSGTGNCTLEATTNLDVVFPGDLLSINHAFVSDPATPDTELAVNNINAASLPISNGNPNPTTITVTGPDPNSPIDIHLLATSVCQDSLHSCVGSGVDFAVTYISGPAPATTNVIPSSTTSSTTSTSTGGPAPSRRSTRKVRGVEDQMRLLALARQQCPVDTEKCLVAGTNDEFECVDTISDPTSCGGCMSTGEGVNCELLPNVKAEGVMCVAGACQVSACEAGFSLTETRDACF